MWLHDEDAIEGGGLSIIRMEASTCAPVVPTPMYQCVKLGGQHLIELLE